MRVTVLLADSAQADPSGKVHLLGVGWTRTAVPTGPVAIVVLLRMESVDEARLPHHVELELIDGENSPMKFLPGPGTTRVTATIEPNPAADIELPAVAPIVLQLGPLDLPVDKTLTWRVTVDDKRDDGWTAPFTTHSRE